MTVRAAGSSRRLAGGSLTVATGLAATGLGTVIMMALSARSLPASEYAAFAVWWTVATLLGTSFGVFEAYLARLVVTDVAAERSARGVIGLMTGRALLAAGVIVVGLLVMAPWLASQLLGGNLTAALLLPVFVVLSAMQALQRGSATGHSKFRAIAGQLSVDGTARAALTIGLVLAGRESVGALAFASCLAAAAGIVVGGRLCPHWAARPRVRDSGVAVRPLVFLLVGAVGPLLANNGSVPWLAGTHSVGAYTLGAFAGAVTLSRIPTQFVSAAFGPLLAQLAHCVEVGDESTFRKLRRTADFAACAIGLLFVAAFATVGPWLLTVYLGPRYQLSVATLATLAAASGLMFVAVVQQASLAALDRWGTIAWAWVLGTLAFIVVLLLPLQPLLAATTAPLAAVATALGVMTLVRPRFVSRPSKTLATCENGSDLPHRTP